MDKEAAKQEIINFLESKSGSKTKFYFNDFTKIFPDMKAREVKKLLSELVQEEKLVYWSSGSTTMYGMKGAGKTAEG
ncbi:Dissimilatory sulfite reductase D [Desulfonatronospira thiodismutans ASO3-1]|uniref:Dissimilatory sulfite reductase D n=1 Tax=Desulfonatronospira thiodismutans ASO3-1 TaxID=555779 RepID=D6SSJ6_9BACT|nr:MULTISPECIES: dissimilatory sulfite reductase D family protein [Desulfonatronospira]EFI33662.1 Dissimilatory sulfite reductase D [Desulfonatronospira thiodismutans ASO3-1]RQD75554.1 MAG: dissimilatory sulfite reductase-asociated protein DsvD [Desulfonatronospira sp. MSAO_Bac3]